MLPVILVAVGAYLIGDSVLEDGKKFAKGGKTKEKLAEYLVTLTDEDGYEDDVVVMAKNEDDAVYKAEQIKGYESSENGVVMLTDFDGNKIEYAKGGEVPKEIYSGKDIKITIPKMGKFDEQKVVAVYDKDNFVFKIYDKDKKRVLTKMGGRNFESNLINGSYKMDGYMAKGGEVVQKNGYKIKYNKIYEKWQVSKNKVVYEEFSDKEKAIEWAENNKMAQGGYMAKGGEVAKRNFEIQFFIDSEIDWAKGRYAKLLEEMYVDNLPSNEQLLKLMKDKNSKYVNIHKYNADYGYYRDEYAYIKDGKITYWAKNAYMAKGGEVGGRGWEGAKKGERITDIKDFKVGEVYLSYNPQFNSKNLIRITSLDKTELKRPIVYASFVRKGVDEGDFAIWDYNLKTEEFYKAK